MNKTSNQPGRTENPKTNALRDIANTPAKKQQLLQQAKQNPEGAQSPNPKKD